MTVDLILTTIILLTSTIFFVANKNSNKKIKKSSKRQQDFNNISQSKEIPDIHNNFSTQNNQESGNMTNEMADTYNPPTSRNGLLSKLSQMTGIDPDDAKSILQELETSQKNCVNNFQDLMFKIYQVQIDENRFFNTFRQEILEDQIGRLGIKKTYNVYDCGCSINSSKYFCIDSFNHVVCKDHILMCSRGHIQHRCCIHDSQIINGKTVCIDHMGLMLLRTYPTEKLRTIQRFFSKSKNKRKINL